MKIYFIRHGETTANKYGIWGGNFPLTEKGIKQAEAVDPPEVSLVLCSPLDRAIHTAKIIYPGKELVIDNAFREICFGVVEQTPIIDDSLELTTYINEAWNLHNVVAEADNVFERACIAMRTILRKADELRQNGADGDIALVCHRALMRSMISAIRYQDAHHLMGYDVDNCSIFEMDIDEIKTAIDKIDG